MRFIHCETYQGAIAAVSVEYPTRQLYKRSESKPDSEVISPVVIDQIGEVNFLPPVDTIDEAVATAKAEIERRNRCHVNSVLDDRVSAAEAVQHFEDVGIPLEMVPPLALERPYYIPCPSPPLRYILPHVPFEVITAEQVARQSLP